LFQHDGTNTYIDNSSFAASNRLLDIRSAWHVDFTSSR
jgi:hypothetical protein